jgi:O-antigen ligase
MQNKSNFNFLSIVCALIVPLLVTGPFLPDLLVSVSALWFIYYTIKHKIFYIYKNYYFYIFILFCLVCILSSVLSEDIFLSFQSSLFYFRIGIFALLISFLIDQNKKILDYFYYSFILTFMALLTDGYVQYFTGFNIFGYPLDIATGQMGMRVSSFFGDELILGSYLVRLSPLLLALFVVRKDKTSIEMYCFSFFLILIYLMIFLSGERASFFFLNLFVLFNIFFMKNYKITRLAIFVISISCVIFVLMNNSNYYNRFIKAPLQSFGFDNKIGKTIIFTPQHDSVLRTGWNMFLDKPILGHGPKLFRVKCKDVKYQVGINPCQTHPHNFYIQLLAETGIIGFSFLFGFFIFFFCIVIKHIYDHTKNKKKMLVDYQICLLSGLLITLWPLAPNGNFFNNYLIIVYSLQIGFFRRQASL